MGKLGWKKKEFFKFTCTNWISKSCGKKDVLVPKKYREKNKNKNKKTIELADSLKRKNQYLDFWVPSCRLYAITIL